MEMSGATSGAVANAHDVNLRRIVQDKILHKMLKHVTQLTHGWVVLVVDDQTTRILSYAVRMSDLTDCGVSIIERLELNRQPFPEMNVVYFVAPTVENIRKVAADFADPEKPKYNDAYLYFLSHAETTALDELKNAIGLLPRLKALQEVHVDFLALEKCAFSFDMPNAFHQLYSPAAKKDDAQIMQTICDKLISVCASLEEYPYVRYKADQPRMEKLAQMFQAKINEFVAKNDSFTYAANRGTLFFIDRGQDLVAPVMHESTFQAMIYDLLEVEEEQITYQAETNSGMITKTAFLNENDKFWIEFRHTHIAKVSEEIGRRMAQLSASNAGTSLGKGKPTDLRSMAAALRELPEYREMLGKLSQHLWLAGRAMDLFTKSSLLEASNIEQCMASGVDESGKKVKHSTLSKQLEDLFKDPKISESDRFRVAVVFALTQDTMKEPEKKKFIQAANLSRKYDFAMGNLFHIGGGGLYKQNGNSLLTADEIKEAGKKATEVEYSNARYEPRLKSIVQRALRNTLDEQEYPYIIAPPLKSSYAPEKKNAPISLRKKGQQKAGKEAGAEKEDFVGEKMLVFICGGATYSELRSIYELRASEKRDVVLGTTSFIKPKAFLESLSALHEATPPPPVSTGHGAEVMPLTSGEIHIQMESQQKPLLPNEPVAASSTSK
ncbi:hypothetical protein Poli38472_000935 [Pythium oligandrum]|uniref:SM/Sec1-family protein n=1 Tax=Pythium oligandrum TaxID=41045 RepID=A0A8K1CE40_PYTOL|nr:hypothetical protein Poli38472_000935 [Pythium oligandrum]|eukprot:TMW60893.1 hypothetical protein Poli38472_000935 [Pythium oligandrum]